jgi:cysteine dioxygenase
MVSDFFASLDQYRGRLPLGELINRLRKCPIEFEDVGEFVHFGRDRYQRNLMHAGATFHALVLCWRPGQRSPIHDHRHSSCAVKVLRGVATETHFEKSRNGLIYPTFTRELPERAVCGSQDSDIHQVSNLQPEDDLVTLHVYSPPLLVMGTYSLTEPTIAEFNDPIVEFALGGGI